MSGKKRVEDAEKQCNLDNKKLNQSSLEKNNLNQSEINQSETSKEVVSCKEGEPYNKESQNQKDTKNCDILIIGGGPSGLTAAIYAARAGFTTIVIEELVTGGQIVGTELIENYPGYVSISGADLAFKLTEQAEKVGAEIIYDEIIDIDCEGKIVTCVSTKIGCHAIIVATGAGPRELECENADKFSANTHYCAICDGAFYKNRAVVVVGGGNSAIEEAIYLADIASYVTVVNNRSELIAQQILVDRLAQKNNVEIHNDSIVARIEGEKSIERVIVFDTVNQKELTVNCDGVFVAIGRAPKTALFEGKLDLNKWNYIKANEHLETSVRGVFVAGDVREKEVRQIITACADGALAATHAGEYIRTISK